MAIETFTWRTQGLSEGSYAQRVRTAQFGDGYKQVTGNGINIETQTWPLSFSGQKAEILPLLAFVRAHTTKSFVWTPPFGEKGLYRVVADSIKTTPIGGHVVAVSVTFEQAFAP
ncbi:MULTISPECIES: phage tail protein [unclassified Serratia (in: enterobacteria)]|uniref:phage tail protein n=1 Tax=unclassified Serratia (in: enterobacteria) TaxID=2647522 RepID=UPI0005065E8E|nr:MULTISPECIES: phage tail protein [unclassified Serratia (in: enterobacteria)]KFK92857.1 phage tail protein [Serratia sp. Ag2]KFK94149.1 phage tail protein [Serratia sp. Ag1]